MLVKAVVGSEMAELLELEEDVPVEAVVGSKTAGPPEEVFVLAEEPELTADVPVDVVVVLETSGSPEEVVVLAEEAELEGEVDVLSGSPDVVEVLLEDDTLAEAEKIDVTLVVDDETLDGGSLEEVDLELGFVLGSPGLEFEMWHRFRGSGATVSVILRVRVT